ncbi:MAG TPA: FAD-dependent oxidoreductase [Microlunatus sp.]|nr:FAD-dependent oxidoreductase [Microlunatus sp.]
MEYDAIVIGAGQAGPGVAAALVADGQRTLLVEMDRVGGTCLNHGCRPTKALRASGVIAHQARRAAEYGVYTGEVRVDFPTAINRVHSLIDGMREGLHDWLVGIDGLDLDSRAAALIGDPAGRSHRVTVGEETHTTGKVYLDIGGRAAVPRIEGLDTVDYLTEVELLNLTALPRHLVVVGGGYIGLEFGQMFRRLGAEVTILAGSGIASREDPDVVEALTEVLTDEGVTIRNVRPQRVAPTGDGDISVETGEGEPVVGSHLLVATGRTSNLDLLGPEHGLDTDDRGFVTIGPRYETSLPGIWALGDVNGHGAFTHTAYQDSQILLNPPRTVTGRVTTYAMFTDPPLGRVGMNNAEARASGRNVLVAEVPMSSVSRAKLESETAGVMRVLVDGDSEEILGATILGLQADDVVQIVGLAIQAGVRYPSLRDALPIHPTVAEFLPSILGSLKPLD